MLLTTYGCDYGYVEWEIGTTNILGHPLDAKRQITQTGPGFYKARCKEDFMVNSDWVTVYVELDGSIVPVMSGPNSLCPNTAATVTTAGCPSGYYNSWSTLEQGGFAYGGNSVTVYLPQTVKLRCIKNDNSWGSDEKPLTIASAIPDDIKITSNSPVVSGGTALLSGTSIAGASYLWTPPAGVSLPVLNTRVLQIPNATTAQAGDYQLKINSGGCEVALSARLDVDLCDNLYVKAFDPTNGEEKTRLNRKPGQLNLYDDLVLEAQTFDGEILRGVEHIWTLPQGVTAGQDPAEKHKITINKIGNYKVNVTSTGGASCALEIDISALACATPTDFLTCGSASTVTSTGTEKLKNLAVGDVFSTFDYVVSVTEVSGSEATGWTGRGYIEMNFLKLGPTALTVPLAVRFDNIHLNQCYQLLPGSKVVTEFDPTWSNMVSVDVITDRLSAVYAEIRDLLATNPDDKQALQKKVDELNAIKTDLATSGFRPDWITQQTTGIDGVITTASCFINSANSRSINSCSAGDLVDELIGATTTLHAPPAFLLQVPETLVPSAEDKPLTEALLRDALNFSGDWKPITFSNQQTGSYKTWGQVYVVKYNGETYWYYGGSYYIQGTCLKNQDPSTARLSFKKCVSPNSNGTCNYECVDLEAGTGLGSQLVDMMAYGFVGIMGTVAAAPTTAALGAAAGSTTLGQTAAGQFIANNTAQWLTTSFAEAWAFCYACNEEQFASKFTEVLAANIVMDGALKVTTSTLKPIGKKLYAETLKNPTFAKFARMPEMAKANWRNVIAKFKVVKNPGKFTTINEFWAKIVGNVDEVKDAFTTTTLKYTQTDIIVFRHCSVGAPQLSNWFTDEILSASQARIKLALPNGNTAQRVVKVKVPKGTAYVEGGVASQVNNPSGLFGSYATGGGKQFYFLDEDKVLFQVIEDISNPMGN